MEKKVLIVKVSALGDVIHALPVLPYLKSVNPEMKIDWVVEEVFAPLLRNHPMINEVITLRTRTWRRHPFASVTRNELRELLARSRSSPYEAVLDLQGNCKSGLVSLLSRAKKRYGFDRTGVREWPNLLTTNRRVALSASEYHITARALLVAASSFPGGVIHASAGPLFVDGKSAERVGRLLASDGISGRPFAVFHCGASWPTKCWDLDRWKQLVRRVSADLNMCILLTWGNEVERAACIEINEAARGQARIWPRSNLPDIMALLARAQIVVGGDTGLIHMAAALGTPTVSLFFVTDNSRNAPMGHIHRRLQSSMECSPCLKRKCHELQKCSRSIEMEDVFQAINELSDTTEKESLLP